MVGTPTDTIGTFTYFDKESQLNRLDLKLGKVESTGFFLCEKGKVRKSQCQMNVPSACNFIEK